MDPLGRWSLLAAELDTTLQNFDMEALVIAVAVSQLMPPTSPEQLASWHSLAKCIFDLKIRVLCLMYATEGLSCTLLQNRLTHMGHDTFVISANPDESVGLRSSILLGIGPRVHLSGPWARTPFDCSRWRAMHMGNPSSWQPLPRIFADAGPRHDVAGCGALHRLRMRGCDARGDGQQS